MSAPAALPSVSRDALTTDWAKLLGANGQWVFSDIASIIALVAADGNGYKRFFIQGFSGTPYEPPVDTAPNSLLDPSDFVGTDVVQAASFQTGAQLVIKFRMKYTLGDGDTLTLVGKIKNLNDESEYDFFATTSTSQDFVFSQPSDDGYVEIHINISDFGPEFSANSEWRGGAEPSKQNGPKTSGGTIGATGPYEIILYSLFTTAAGGSSLEIDEMSFDLIKQPGA